MSAAHKLGRSGHLATEEGIADFQRARGLKVTGQMNKSTRAALRHVRNATTHHKDMLVRGMKSKAVMAMEKLLVSKGELKPAAADGVYDGETAAALKHFKEKHQPHGGLKGGNVAAAPTLRMLAGTTGLAATLMPTTFKPSGEAQIHSVSGYGLGKMATGSITVNGHSYQFRSGGGGRGYLPRGEYTVAGESAPLPTMRVGNVAFSFNLSDKYDSRVGDTRTALRIHPDGGPTGTIGCIGIVGDESTQRRFEADMRAELARNGGRYTLHVK